MAVRGESPEVCATRIGPGAYRNFVPAGFRAFRPSHAAAGLAGMGRIADRTEETFS